MSVIEVWKYCINVHVWSIKIWKHLRCIFTPWKCHRCPLQSGIKTETWHGEHPNEMVLLIWLTLIFSAIFQNCFTIYQSVSDQYILFLFGKRKKFKSSNIFIISDRNCGVFKMHYLQTINTQDSCDSSYAVMVFPCTSLICRCQA